jgi:uncharacterized protein involved in response to NO
MIANTGSQPFRVFFLLAALDAIAGVAVWLALPLGIDTYGFAPAGLAIFHREELLSGTAPAVFAGVILTALPRWTRRPPISPFIVYALAATWLAARATHAFAPLFAALVAALFICLLALAIASRVVPARDRRNVKVIMLLALLAAGTAIAGTQSAAAAGELGTRICLAAILGVLMVLGGRIVPAVTGAYLGEAANAFPPAWRTRIELAAGTSAAFALGAWAVSPDHEGTALACALAAFGQAVRLLQWRGWRVAAKPGLLILHVGYGWIAAGFAFAAAAPHFPGLALMDAAIHAWTAGAIGLCSLGVMSSMLRRYSGIAFQSPPLLSAAYACALAAVTARLLATFLADARPTWFNVSAAAWIAAYALFLLFFETAPLRTKSAPEIP